jgi:hypothetical protein
MHESLNTENAVDDPAGIAGPALGTISPIAADAGAGPMDTIPATIIATETIANANLAMPNSPEARSSPRRLRPGRPRLYGTAAAFAHLPGSGEVGHDHGSHIAT